MSDSDPDRHPIDVVAEEFARRCRAGERPSVSDYANQHPELAEQLRELLPSIAMMERLKTNRRSSSAVATAPRLERLGDFRIVREVGRGGMGVVYEAVQESLGRKVALKVLSTAATLDPTRLARFDQEARAAARLHHTNIVPVFGVAEQDGLHYYVMQLIEGQALGDVVKALAMRAARAGVGNGTRGGRSTPGGVAGQTRMSAPPGGAAPGEAVGLREGHQRQTRMSAPPGGGGPRGGGSTSGGFEGQAGTRAPSGGSEAGLPVEAGEAGKRYYFRWVARVGQQVAQALHYAHGQGVLHRDVKPANLLLDGKGAVWITDFGLAKVGDDSNVTRTGDIVGTLQYLAPEALKNQADLRADIYGLGLSLHEMLTLRPPYGDSTPAELIRRISNTDPPGPRTINSAIPRDLETVVLKAIARDPDHRYQTAGELAADLEAFLQDRPIRARRASAGERLWRWCRRNRAVAALSAAAIALALTAMVVGWVGFVNTRAALAGESSRRHEAEVARADADRARIDAERATRRAEENVQLSLRAFEEIFNRVSDQEGGDATPPPPRREGGGGGGGGGPPMRRPQNVSASSVDATMLQSVLTFYDRFAQQNATNRALNLEAARAYRRVGDLYRWLDEDDKADPAYERAASMYEALLASEPERRDYAKGLAEAASAIAPPAADDKAGPAASAKQVRRLRVALELLEPAVSKTPDTQEVRPLSRALHSLADHLDRAGAAAEAEAAFRRALALWAIAVPPENPGRPGPPAALDRADVSMALAALLARERRDKDAQQVLKEAGAAIQADLAPDGPRRPGRFPTVEPIARLFETLAEVSRRLNDAPAAGSATEQAARVRGMAQRLVREPGDGPRGGPRGGPGGGPGGPGEGPPEGPRRGPPEGGGPGRP